jgi:hypothetical protein
MSSFRSLFLALPIVVASMLTGCAANSGGDQADESTGAATASAPITLANYMSHPKIVAVRNQVGAIDHLALTKKSNPGCDGSNEEYLDAQGRVRKLVAEGGEGDSSGRTTVYYNEQKQPIFQFTQEVDFDGNDHATVTESRIYFDVASTHTLFEAVRQQQETQAAAADATFDNLLPSTIPDRLPTPDETVASSATFASPEQYFASTGCPAAEKQ